LAKSYNPPKDEGYKTRTAYTSVPQLFLNNTGYMGVIFPYSQKQENHRPKVKSKCPRGAILGNIGSCCGNACTRACAIPD